MFKKAFPGIEMHSRFGSRFIFGISVALLFPAGLLAQTLSETENAAGKPGTLDCTKVSIDYLNDPTLTHDERIALMDRALLKSLSQYDACQTAGTGSSGAGGGSNGAGSAGAGDGSGSGGGQKSLAAQGMTGTEKPASTAPSAENLQSATLPPPDGDPQSATGEPAGPQGESIRSLDNGKVPEDIPPADNDSILEAQIRQAAINERDPEIKKKLWNEYRKYKGLPRVM